MLTKPSQVVLAESVLQTRIFPDIRDDEPSGLQYYR